MVTPDLRIIKRASPREATLPKHQRQAAGFLSWPPLTSCPAPQRRRVGSVQEDRTGLGVWEEEEEEEDDKCNEMFPENKDGFETALTIVSNYYKMG